MSRIYIDIFHVCLNMEIVNSYENSVFLTAKEVVGAIDSPYS